MTIIVTVIITISFYNRNIKRLCGLLVQTLNTDTEDLDLFPLTTFQGLLMVKTSGNDFSYKYRSSRPEVLCKKRCS